MICVTFERDSLTFVSEEDHKRVSILYRDHPAVFGHPRFLMNDFDKSTALVRDSLRQFVSRWSISPRITIRVQRELAGGVTEIDRRVLTEIFIHAGTREVVYVSA